MRRFDIQGIEIRAPRDRVFEFLRDPGNLPHWAKAFVSAADGRARLETAAGTIDVGLHTSADAGAGTVDRRADAGRRMCPLGAEKNLRSPDAAQCWFKAAHGGWRVLSRAEHRNTVVYEIGADVILQVMQKHGDESELFLKSHNGKIHFNLWEANRFSLERAGVGQIEICEICTACHTEDWFSHRAEKGRTGRFGALISLQ